MAINLSHIYRLIIHDKNILSALVVAAIVWKYLALVISYLWPLKVKAPHLNFYNTFLSLCLIIILVF